MPKLPTPKPPRKRKSSDENYNARRRYLRNAERYLNKADATIGAEASRYKALAREFTAKAAELYTRNADIERSGAFNKLSERLGINVSEFMQGRKPTEREKRRGETLIRESRETTLPDGGRGMTRADIVKFRREQEAQAILHSDVGSRIYAGTVEIWTDDVSDVSGDVLRKKNVEDINKAIMEHFGVSSMMDVIELLEEKTGISLFANPESAEKYDIVTLAISRHV